jgi:hypothetical protein
LFLSAIGAALLVLAGCAVPTADAPPADLGPWPAFHPAEVSGE